MMGGLNNVKKVINAQVYSDGILERAQDTAISKEDHKIIENIPNKVRCKKGSRGYGRK
jgi:hypothetical protein